MARDQPPDYHPVLSGAVRCIALHCIALSPRESRCIIASRCVTLWSTVVITRWLVRGTGSTTGLPSGAPGRGALHCIALSPRESRCIIALRCVTLWSTVVITRWLVRGTGSTTGLPSGAPGARRVASHCVIAARSVTLWSTVVITRWLVRGTGSTTGLPFGAPGARCVALYRAIAARIALRYRIAERHVM